MAKVKIKKTESVSWKDDVRNPENKEFVNEVAFNKGYKDLKKVTQAEFNERYGIKPVKKK